MRTFALLSAPLLITACGPTLLGSGTPATVSHEVDGVGFENDSPATARVTIGDAPGVRVTCDDNLVDAFVVQNNGGVVRLSMPGVQGLPRTDCSADVTLSGLERVANLGSGGVSVSAEVRDVRELENSGSGRLQAAGVLEDVTRIDHHGSGGVRLAGVDTCDLSVAHTGSGGMSIDDVVACELAVDATGSGATRFAGQAERLELAVRGSGGFGDEALAVRTARIVLSGSGAAEVTVLDAVEVRLSGSGGARIHGAPADRSVDDTGSGQVRFE